MKNLNEALRCREALNWCVFPLKPQDKIPFNKFGWGKLQEQIPDKNQILAWWKDKPDANIGVVTGRISNLVVVDIDDDKAFNFLGNHNIYLDDEPTPISKTQRGWQFFFTYPEDGVKHRDFEHGEIRSDGHYVVIPPSIHPSGIKYEWVKDCSPYALPLASPPKALIEFANTASNENSNGKANEIAEVIREGVRNTTLTSLAGSMRHRGVNQEEIYELLMVVNRKRCQPPLLEKEVLSIARSVVRYEPKKNVVVDLSDLHQTDSGNAEAIVSLFSGRLRFDNTLSKWLTWSGHTWGIDNDGEAERITLDTARARLKIAADIDEKEARKKAASWALQSESKYRISAALAMASKMKPMSVSHSDFNSEPWLLGCKNGVIDLRNGTFGPGEPCDMISISTGVEFDPEARAPRWEQFLDEVFQGKTDIIDYVHRGIGYSLTGLTVEQVFFLLVGVGENGKTVFLTVFRIILGAYCANTPFSTFELSRYDGSKISNDVAALAGKRLVTASEVKENAQLNEGRMKAMTGEDEITARFLHREYFTFNPAFKVWLSVNHKPRVTDTTYSFWRRIRVIPFERKFTGAERDNNLVAKLREERAGILNWAIQGCLKWQEDGLEPPEQVTSATDEYRNEMDIVRLFLSECTDSANSDVKIESKSLYKAYTDWCDENGEETMTGTMFGRKMKEIGFEKKPYGGSRRVHYIGVGLLSGREG